ncbi:3,4-dihydroxy-2-butanone-4-phosphate synthase, partial [Agrobacterium radiobacter]
ALDIPLMVSRNTESLKTAFTVSVDYIPGTTTGISAADRAKTVRALVSEDSRPEDFARPGHIFPLRANPQGVLGRTGHTEAAVDL